MRFLAHYTLYNGLILHLNIVDLSDNKVAYFKVKEETAHTLFIEGILLICPKLSADSLKTMNMHFAESKFRPIKDIAEYVNMYVSQFNNNSKELKPYQIKWISQEQYFISEL